MNKNLFFQILILGVLSFLLNCNSLQVIPEPNLDQVTVKSETICTEFTWYSPFCTMGKAKSLMIKGIYYNSTGDKKYALVYHLDMLDTDLPVGLSIYLDGTYYNLKKVSTDYTDIVKLESELSPEVITKIIESKKNLFLSYSNRKDTLNFGLSDRESRALSSQLNEVVKKINEQEKMKIVK
ncbi:MAG: hypothetical protein IPL26_29330 [Leptospiraceae bacterium]|nr:hypothetical protein [Leptospiraceae bacterium]